MALMKALMSGLAGATAVTLVHETARRNVTSAPRADILGVRAVENVLMAANQQPPTGDQLHQIALAADVVSNTAYYSLVGAGRPRGGLLRGLVLGMLAVLAGTTLASPEQIKAQRSKLEDTMVSIQQQDCPLEAQEGF